MNPTVALVRGKFLNAFEMQTYEPLASDFRITAFGSKTCFHDTFAFPVVKLWSPMDVPEFPYKMSVINRLCVDAHYLWGLEKHLSGFDLVHTAETYYHYTQQALHAKRAGLVKKVIATVLETIPHNNEGIWGRRGFKARSRAQLDHIFALSEKTKQALIAEGCDPAKITVVHFSIDTKRFAPSGAHFASLANPKKRDFTIVCTGRLEIEKGIYDLLDAFVQLIKSDAMRTYTLNLIYIGDGTQKAKLSDKTHAFGLDQHSRIESATYLAMPDILRRADLFVAASKPTQTWEEQYGVALLEAQSMGLPIVTTKSGAIAENVGEAAVLVAPGDVKALHQALSDFILKPAKRIAFAQAARRRAEQVHDVSRGAKRIKKLYLHILQS